MWGLRVGKTDMAIFTDPREQVDEPQAQPSPSFAEETGSEIEGEMDSPQVKALDVALTLTKEQKDEIVNYLEDNLPRMRPDENEVKQIKNYFAMYRMAIRQRNFPYENAPSLASSDAYEKMNEVLDQAETAFLQQKTTFVQDRDSSSLSEEAVQRMEKTFHRKFFLESGFAKDLRLMLFESIYLGASIVAVRENYDLRSTREKVIIKTEDDLSREALHLTSKDQEAAKKAIAAGEIYITERDSLKTVNIGPVANRINQTKFWYPRNTVQMKEWQVVSEQEFYKKSDLIKMAAMGEMDADEVSNALLARQTAYSTYIENQKEKKQVLEDVKPHQLDVDWTGGTKSIQEMGESYDDEYAVYRTTMLYSVPSDKDPSGKVRSWIQVLYCPAGRNILGASFCPDGQFPYYLVKYRPLPFTPLGMGIAAERFHANQLATEGMCLFLASVEQEVGAPMLIRKGSDIYNTGAKSYPASVLYTGDPKNDAMFMPFPEKSRLSVELLKVILGTSPGANQGAGYSSGKREEIVQNDRVMKIKARIHSIASDLDEICNAAWKIYCRLSKLNTDDEKVLPWVFSTPPPTDRIFMLESEMNPNIVWSSVMTAISLTPDARFQEALRDYQLFHKEQPVSVNSPKRTVAWLWHLAGFTHMTDQQKKELLPDENDFAQYQQQLGAMGGMREQAPSTQMAAQSTSTPFRNPQAQGTPAAPQQPQMTNGTMAHRQ